MSQLTTHILDTTKGKPAQNVKIILYKNHNNMFEEIASGYTNQDGRIPDLLPKDLIVEKGIYKMKFDISNWRIIFSNPQILKSPRHPIPTVVR